MGEHRVVEVTITKAFANTQVALDRSTAQIDGLLELHGVRESRITHQKPLDPTADSGENAAGSLTLEFIQPGTDDCERRGLRIRVDYQPTIRSIDRRSHTARKTKGTTAEMAARALFWFLDTKFKAIQYGLEEFDDAFLPHLITQIGYTMAERPELAIALLDEPTSIGQFMLGGPDPEAVEVR